MTLVDIITSISSSTMSGALAVPFTSPLSQVASAATLPDIIISCRIRIVHKNIDLLELCWKRVYKVPNLSWFANVQLEWEDLDTRPHIFRDLLCYLLQVIDSSRSQNQFEVFRRCSRKFHGCIILDVIQSFMTCNQPVLFPIPEEAPVMTIVLPSSRSDMAEAIVLYAILDVKVVCCKKGFLPKAALSVGFES